MNGFECEMEHIPIMEDQSVINIVSSSIGKSSLWNRTRTNRSRLLHDWLYFELRDTSDGGLTMKEFNCEMEPHIPITKDLSVIDSVVTAQGESDCTRQPGPTTPRIWTGTMIDTCALIHDTLLPCTTHTLFVQALCCTSVRREATTTPGGKVGILESPMCNHCVIMPRQPSTSYRGNNQAFSI
jgi:hypothetical protein